jgi:DHA1 family bicyclomycin/chloramphenicol resistance-like MFS transporter
MKNKLLIIFLVAISALPPLSTDMYLPSLPQVVRDLNATDAEANFTLIAFFIAFAASTLLWGPLSDKYGRKPILIVGSIFYFAGSFFCGLSNSVDTMMLARVVQGIGGGSGMAVASAVVKDTYSGRKQEGMLAIIQSMTMVCPVVAPLIGSFIILFTDWRGVFHCQTVLGALLVVGAFVFKETIREKSKVGVFQTIGKLGSLVKHPEFSVMLVLFSLTSIPIMAFVSSSSFVFQDFFRLSPFLYSVCFAASSLGSIAGPFLYMKSVKRFSRRAIVTTCFAALAAVGVLAFVAGEASPVLFTALLFLLGMCCSATRPAGSFLMLNFREQDAGAASALIGSVGFFAGSIGMAIVTVSPRYVLTIGIISVSVSIVCGVLWHIVSKKHNVG